MSASDGASPALCLHLFGPFEVRRNGAPLVRRRSLKGNWLVALLALRHGCEVERTWLAGMLWPDRPTSEALALLRRELTDLRRALGPEGDRLRSPTSRTLRLDLTGAAVDLLEFDQAIENGDLAALEQAVKLYRGSLLEGCEEEWVFQERQVREQAYLQALESLAADAVARGDLGDAERHLRRAVAADPLRESAQRALMQALAAGGNYAAVVQTYRELRERLHQHLNAAPDPETQALFEQLRKQARSKAAGRRWDGTDAGTGRPDVRLLAPDLPADFPSLRTLEARRHNLPVQLTPLIGRETERVALRDLLLRDDVGLVTLTGAGGTGKTRLGLQLAGDLADAFADGAHFVSLAPVRDPRLVASAIAQTLGVREVETRPLVESLKQHLQEKQALLLLDNFEQVLAAAPLVADLLAGASRLKVLVTSRSVLRLQGEHEFSVPPLALPDPDLLPPADTLSRYAAVELFVRQARAVRPDFALTRENAPAVVEICRRLDGLPLAIELAAARLKLFSPQSLLARLERRLPLLTGGARDLPERQQTLRNAIAWSYDLLTEAEQTLFRRLAVFAGSFTLEAAEAVGAGCGMLSAECGIRSGQDAQQLRTPNSEFRTLHSLLRTDAVLEGVESLMDHSMLEQREDNGEPRFGMLETIREFGLECLAASGEEEAVRQQHARFFESFVEPADFHDPTWRREWLERCRQEHDNVRAALAWSLHPHRGNLEPGDIETALRLAGAMGWFWQCRGHWTEGRRWLQEALARSDPAARTPARALALQSAAYLAADKATARDLQRESVLIRRELGDLPELAVSLCVMGWAALDEGDPAAACPFLEEAVAIARETGIAGVLVPALNGLRAVAQSEGDFKAALAYSRESVATARAMGDSLPLTWALAGRGLLAVGMGDYLTARRSFEESLQKAREADNRGLVLAVLSDLGSVARDQGDYAGARSLGEEQRAMAQETGDPLRIAQALHDLGCLAYAEDDLETAQALLIESRDRRRDLGDRPGMAASLIRLAQVALAQDEEETAQVLLSERTKIGSELRNHREILAQSLLLQARGALRRADGRHAAELCAQSLSLRQKGGSQRELTEYLETMAATAVILQQPERAVRLFGTAEAMREAMGTPLPPIERSEYKGRVAAARTRLGEEAFRAALAEGRLMTVEQAIETALRIRP